MPDDARFALFESLIDYAGLFPPESLDMPAAIAGYRQARESPEAFMLGRFIVPVSRTGELAGELTTTSTDNEAAWPLVVLFDSAYFDWPQAVAADAKRLGDFLTELGTAVRLETVELRLHPSAGLASISRVLGVLEPFGVGAFFEVGIDGSLSQRLGLLATARSGTSLRIGAKLRTGGTVAEAFPSPGGVAAFIAGCRDRGLPIKATAGLHHPIRYHDHVTGFDHHGFLNLLTASVLARVSHLSEAEIKAVVAEEDSTAFVLGADGLAWRNLRANLAQVAEARTQALVAYGSCSFREPADDLRALGVFPLGSSL